MDDDNPDIASPSHQRAPYSDPLADGMDPTAPGAPHEPGGSDYRQSEDDSAPRRATEESDDHGRSRNE